MSKSAFIEKFGGQTTMKIENYVDRIDPMLRRAIYSLDSETKLAIMIALSEKGKQSFTQLMRILGLDQSTLNYHLKKLIHGTLIENYYQKVPYTSEYSFYDLTEFGRNFLTKLTELVSFPLLFIPEKQSIVYEPESEVIIP